MNQEAELPEDVVEALRANRKIEAIKLLRGHRGIGLKEAKDIVDGHAADNVDDRPPSARRQAPRGESSLGRFILACLVGAAAYGLYYFISA